MLNILINNNSGIMGNPIFNNLKSQASYYFKEKIKTARLALTDVTPAELLTEEATNGNPWPPDTRAMGVISRAAFEVDDYWRIVEILHRRLLKFDRKNWRASYNALILLEHLLTHGPKRIAEEFESDEEVIKEMGNFHYIDEKCFNWGLSVRKLSERILELLESEQILTEERERARKITREIKGFGSFSEQTSSDNESFGDSFIMRTCAYGYGRSNSYYGDYLNRQDKFLELNESFLIRERTKQVQESIKDEKPTKTSNFWVVSEGDEYYNIIRKNHPFCDNDHELQTKTSLLNDTE